MSNHKALLGLTIAKKTDVRTAPNVSIWLEIHGVGRVDVELTAGQFAHIIGSSILPVDASFEPEVPA